MFFPMSLPALPATSALPDDPMERSLKSAFENAERSLSEAISVRAKAYALSQYLNRAQSADVVAIRRIKAFLDLGDVTQAGQDPSSILEEVRALKGRLAPKLVILEPGPRDPKWMAEIQKELEGTLEHLDRLVKERMADFVFARRDYLHELAAMPKPDPNEEKRVEAERQRAEAKSPAMYQRAYTRSYGEDSPLLFRMILGARYSNLLRPANDDSVLVGKGGYATFQALQSTALARKSWLGKLLPSQVMGEIEVAGRYVPNRSSTGSSSVGEFEKAVAASSGITLWSGLNWNLANSAGWQWEWLFAAKVGVGSYGEVTGYDAGGAPQYSYSDRSRLTKQAGIVFRSTDPTRSGSFTEVAYRKDPQFLLEPHRLIIHQSSFLRVIETGQTSVLLNVDALVNQGLKGGQSRGKDEVRVAFGAVIAF